MLSGLLSKKQLSRLAGICTDIAQVSLATIAIPFAIDRAEPLGVVLGLLVSLIFWIFSLLLERVK